MALLPRKPRKQLAPKLTDMVGHLAPQHDQPCKRVAYSDPKSLFDMLKDEAQDG
jgi:hypothetical protein